MTPIFLLSPPILSYFSNYSFLFLHLFSPQWLHLFLTISPPIVSFYYNHFHSHSSLIFNPITRRIFILISPSILSYFFTYSFLFLEPIFTTYNLSYYYTHISFYYNILLTAIETDLCFGSKGRASGRIYIGPALA